MLTLIRMAGWDVVLPENYTSYLLDPEGTAIMVPYLAHEARTKTLFKEFLRLKQYL